jgi:hypothetical protein
MRADMAKVIVERPRFGSRDRHRGKGRKRDAGRLGYDGLPRREGIKRQSGGTKFFNEHLGPLRRYLLSNVGRPWDKVFSEICAHINRNSAVQDHVRDHVFDYVAVHVIEIDGVACSKEPRLYGTPLHEMFWRRPLLYVCPRTGLLRRARQVSRKRRERPSPAEPRSVRLDDTRQCHWIDGGWHLVTVEPLPFLPHLSPARDVVLKVKVSSMTPDSARKMYGAPVYAVAVRRLGKHELRQYPVPLD